MLQATSVAVLQHSQFSRRWSSGQALLMSLKLTPAALVVLDMKTGIFNAVECIFEHIQAYQSKLQDIHTAW